jgi:hypothetical protein
VDAKLPQTENSTEEYDMGHTVIVGVCSHEQFSKPTQELLITHALKNSPATGLREQAFVILSHTSFDIDQHRKGQIVHTCT